jgi:hypothetical protein
MSRIGNDSIGGEQEKKGKRKFKKKDGLLVQNRQKV